jgi:carbon-monoxide dehydrogenase catalytic subunit
MSKISAHESVVQMYEKLKKDGVTNIWDRWQEQERIRCKTFCAQGLSCQFCSNGPCRIVPGKVDRGTCGMDANGMPMRYMLLRNAMGMSTYTYHAREVAKTLIATGEGKTPYRIRDEAKLRSFAEKVGLDASGDVNRLAIKVGNFLLEEINKDASTPLKIVEAFAPEARKRKWRDLGIFPGGPTNENIDAVFAVAFGLYTHVSPTPPLTGGKELVKLLTSDVEGLTGGKFAVETDVVAIADGIEAHIVKKRKALGI